MRTRPAWAALLLCAALPVNADPPAGRAKVRIVLAGDSTVTDDAGWGGAFAKHLAQGVDLTNMARGGRSSKSFADEGLWRKCLDLRPDYVLVQFGHNDQPGKGPARETLPETTYRANMARYVDEARAAGIAPVLVTSLARRQFGDDGKIRSTLVPYVEVVKRLAAEKRVPLVDLHARSIELYETLGRDGCVALSPRTPDGGVDGTHLNPEGARRVARLVVDELRKAVPALAESLRLDPVAGAEGDRAVTVAVDGGGDFASIRRALASIPEDARGRTVLHIKPRAVSGTDPGTEEISVGSVPAGPDGRESNGRPGRRADPSGPDGAASR